MTVAGEWVASVDSSGSVKHWTKGEAKNQAPTKRELHRQQESSGYVHSDLHMVRRIPGRMHGGYQEPKHEKLFL